MMWFLAQEAAAQPWYSALLDNGLLIVIAFIFLVAIVGVVVKRWKKDKCLKMIRGYHASYLTADGKAMWGDVVVYSQGLELRFDAPYTTARGLVKGSALVYGPEVEASCLAVLRHDAGLTDPERRSRRRQVERTFRPNVIRRSLRWFRNLVNTLRDAFSKAFSTVVGAVIKTRPGGSVAAAHSGEIDTIGQTLLSAAGNAYEPMLEAHIGRPVVLTMAAAGKDAGSFELPGYLADYSDAFLAVFNVDHEVEEGADIRVGGGGGGGGEEPREGAPRASEAVGVKVELVEEYLRVTCVGLDPVVVRSVTFGGEGRGYDLDVPLVRGASVRVVRPGGDPGSELPGRREGEGGAVGAVVRVERVRRLDVVVPRKRATIHFGGEPLGRREGGGLLRGLAPWRDAEEAAAAKPPEASPPHAAS